MKKRKKITVRISPDGRTAQIEAYCLATDSWADFNHFLNAAQDSKKRGVDRDANRELRAALLCLFSHLEGTVRQILLEHANEIGGADRARTLYDRTKVITREAKKRDSVADLNFRLGKYLRDIVAHPGIEKKFGGGTVDEIVVFERLTIQTVSELGLRIDVWLDRVCSIFKVTRFTDMKAMVEQLTEGLGTIDESREK
ncbi:MAG: hypothetical protein ABIL68_16275 [bacterium]